VNGGSRDKQNLSICLSRRRTSFYANSKAWLSIGTFWIAFKNCHNKPQPNSNFSQLKVITINLNFSNFAHSWYCQWIYSQFLTLWSLIWYTVNKEVYPLQKARHLGLIGESSVYPFWSWSGEIPHPSQDMLGGGFHLAGLKVITIHLQSPMFSRSWHCQKQYLSSLIFTVRDGLLRIAIKSGVNIL